MHHIMDAVTALGITKHIKKKQNSFPLLASLMPHLLPYQRNYYPICPKEPFRQQPIPEGRLSSVMRIQADIVIETYRHICRAKI